MPWTAEQFKEKKEGLTDSQAEKAASIANDVLERCLEDGELSRDKCEEAAIKQGLGVVSNMKRINIKVNAEGQVRHEEVNGREYLVAPVVAVKEGVLNYEDGTEFIPAEEIKNTVDAWNGVDLPIGHPEQRGKPISAKNKVVVDKNAVGRMWNAHYEDKKLKGELWVDIEKAKNMGSRAQEVVNKLENEEPIDVSTAYKRQFEPKSGEYDGETYDGIQKNLQPDHLALLPDSTGNMSWSDGVGTPRINSEGKYEMRTNASMPSYNGTEAKDWSAIKKTFTAFKSALDIEADKSWGELTDSERTNIKEHFLSPSDENFTSNSYPVVNPVSNQLNRNAVANAKARSEQAGDSDVRVMADRLWNEEFAEEEAQNIANKVIDFVKNHFRGDNQMSEALETVVENTGYEKDDLEDMDEGKIEEWAEAYNSEPEEPEEPEDDETVENEDETDEEDGTKLKDKVEDQEQKINELKEKLDKKEREEKQELLDQITANSDFEEDEIEDMDKDKLEKLASNVKPKDYSGLGAANLNDTSDAFTPPSLDDFGNES